MCRAGRSPVAAALLGITALGAEAQDDGKIVNVRNAGAFACEDVIKIVEGPELQLEKTAFMQWTAAYVTAASRSNSLIDVFPIGDTWELVRMTRLVCYENKSFEYELALRIAIGRLRPFWISDRPDILTLGDPNGREIQFYVEAVPALQRALKDKGAVVLADGKFGNQTGRAIHDMNAARGYEPWSTPDGDLLYHLTR
ncbi:hypothetical protein [Tropicimonas sp.]|uniref:hypothetical protein n=1 Tax=Tropicimonas sp. TaxID=2067044 RepID=UPI003A88D703